MTRKLSNLVEYDVHGVFYLFPIFLLVKVKECKNKLKSKPQSKPILEVKK